MTEADTYVHTQHIKNGGKGSRAPPLGWVMQR